MRYFTTLSLLLAIPGSASCAPASSSEDKVLEARTYNECSAVNGLLSIFKQYDSSATAFCSSFISIPLKTVTALSTASETPPAITVGATVSVIPTVSVAATTTITPTVIYTASVTPAAKRDVLSPELKERGNAPLPPYCSGFPSAQISTACSCLSISPSCTTVNSNFTVTASRQTITVKATITAGTTVKTTVSTVTVTASPVTDCANALPTFILKLANSNIVLNGVALDGTYGQLDTGDGDIIGFNGSPRSEAIVLSLNAAGNLVMDQNGYIGYTDAGQQMELLHFDTLAVLTSNGGIPPVCSVSSGQLKCADGAINILQLCPGFAVTDDIFIGTSIKSGCVSPTFDVVPLCTVPGK